MDMYGRRPSVNKLDIIISIFNKTKKMYSSDAHFYRVTVVEINRDNQAMQPTDFGLWSIHTNALVRWNKEWFRGLKSVI